MPNMPTQNIGLRIESSLLAALDALAVEQGTTRTAIIIDALHSRLGVDSKGSVEQRLTAVEQRLAIVEQSLGSGAQQRPTAPNTPTPTPTPKHPRQDAREGASKAAQASQHPPESGGLSVGAALIAAGAEVLEAHAMGSNRDERMRARYGVKAAAWLQLQGWRVEGRKWYPPAGSGEELLL
jgi:hypothetical protein